MRLFAYGTLRDPDVLRAVLGYAVHPTQFRGGWLDDHLPLRVAGQRYPILVSRPGGRAEGAIISSLSTIDLERLDAYEGPDYRRSERDIQVGGGRTVAAAVYTPRPGIAHDGTIWDYKSWALNDKPHFLREDVSTRLEGR